MFGAKPAWTSRKSPRSTTAVMTWRTSYACLPSAGHDRRAAPGSGSTFGSVWKRRRILEVVGRQEAQQPLAEEQRLVVVLGDEVHDARVGHVRVGAAELLGGHDLAGHLLDDLRAGDEHLRLPRLDDEVGQRRAVGRAAGARAADERDLRHRAREHHVRVEDLAVAGEGVDAFLHARAARVVDEDERRAGLQRHLHHVGDLGRVDLAGRAAAHREVLAGEVDEAPGDGRRPGDDAVGREVLVRPCRTAWRGAARTGPTPGSCRDRPARRCVRARRACRPCAASRGGPARRPARGPRASAPAPSTARPSSLPSSREALSSSFLFVSRSTSCRSREPGPQAAPTPLPITPASPSPCAFVPPNFTS